MTLQTNPRLFNFNFKFLFPILDYPNYLSINLQNQRSLFKNYLDLYNYVFLFVFCQMLFQNPLNYL